MTRNLLIRGARLTDPSTGTDGVCDVLVVDGHVSAVGERIAPSGRILTVDGSGLWVWPGLVDLHVHFREPGYTHKETLASGCAAALRGGYTSVVCEPNTDPPIDRAELAAELAARARAVSPVRVYFKAAMTRGRAGRELTDYAALAAERAVVALSDDGDPVTRAGVMDQICRQAARHGLCLSPHCEDSARALKDYEAGVEPGFKVGPAFENEAAYVGRDIETARRAGCRIHFSHVSLRRSVELIESARLGGAVGARVTFEATPHHLLLSKADYGSGEIPAVCPPLRSRDDMDALRGALAKGIVDAVASDHAPHTAEEKATGAMGLIGLETTLGLILSHFLHAGALPPMAAADAMSTRPARALGLRAGSLAVGEPADMVFIDPQEEWEVRSAEFASLARNTPYEGWPMRGRVVATFVNGREAFCRGSFGGRME